MGEKTEKATPKKLRDAKKKGQVAKAQDLPAAFTFVISIAATLGLSRFLYDQLGGFIISIFKMIPHPDLERGISSIFMESFYLMFLCSIPVLCIVSFVGVLITFLSVGPVFAPEVFKPDIKKFNPIDNLKAKFKMKTVIELLKSTLKIFIAGWIVYGVMYKSIPVLTQSVSLPIYGALQIFYYFLIEVITKVGLFFVIVAIFDFMYQKHTFSKEMMMEKFEVKQEYKNTEGDPHIKGKRRQIAQEIAYQEGPAGGMKRAKAVVTNPTHLAIALGYEREIDAAPYIIAMGENILAERLIKIAEDLKIPVIRNIPLAHKLWDEGDIYEYVPEETYEAIAEILRWIASLSEQDERQPPNVSEIRDE